MPPHLSRLLGITRTGRFIQTKDMGLFTDEDEKRHSANRRKVVNAYSMTALVEMEQFVDECTAIFMQRLREFADFNTALDMGHWLQCYAVLSFV
jgi:Cytochrome P450